MKTLNLNNRGSGYHAQRGVTLVVALIALVILLLSAIALIRSLDTSMTTAGNLAFRRDLANQTEIAVQAAAAQLNTISDLTTSVLAKNYSATMLPTNSYGIPNMLVDDSLWTGTAADLSDTASGVTQIRYVIDRLCTTPNPGSPTLSSCAFAFLPRNAKTVTDSVEIGKEPAIAPAYYVYRVSVRAVGPRGTVAYSQSTFMR